MKPYLYGSSSNIHPSYSRDKIINIRGNFCNLFDSDDIPIFDAFIDYLIINNTLKAEDWASRLKDTNTLHVNLDISGDYAENLGWAPRYPIPGSDWTNNISTFRRIIDWVLNHGFIPHIHLAADGQGPDPVGLTYGWPWGMVHLPEILPQLFDYRECALFNAGWDGCFPDWNRDQTAQFYQMLRDILGTDAQLAAELSGPGSVGYCHFGNGGSDWYLPGIKEIDCYLIELNTFPQNDTGVQQTAARMLGPAKRNITPSNDGPYYLAAPRERSLSVNMFETCAYQITRKQATGHDAEVIATACANYGFVNFGNGQPL